MAYTSVGGLAYFVVVVVVARVCRALTLRPSPARRTQRSVPPHLCFNLGSMGFLSPFEYEAMKEEVRRIMSGGMKVSLRMRLSARIIRDDQTSEAFHALNEIVIDRGESVS